MTTEVILILLGWAVWTAVCVGFGALLGKAIANEAMNNAFGKASETLDALRDKIISKNNNLHGNHDDHRHTALVSQPLTLDEVERIIDKIQSQPGTGEIRVMGKPTNDLDEKWIADLLREANRKHEEKKEEGKENG